MLERFMTNKSGCQERLKIYLFYCLNFSEVFYCYYEFKMLLKNFENNQKLKTNITNLMNATLYKMIMKILSKYFMAIAAFVLLIILISCDSDHGIEPKPIAERDFGFGGNIVFYGEWPDSIKRMILIAFKDPLLSEDDFVITNIGYLSTELPLNIPTYKYSTLDSALIPLTQSDPPPSIYQYVAVAQQSTEEISLERKDWFVTGIYYADGDTSKPGILTIPEDTFIDGINIYCDFDNHPPQPPGGD